MSSHLKVRYISMSITPLRYLQINEVLVPNPEKKCPWMRFRKYEPTKLMDSIRAPMPPPLMRTRHRPDAMRHTD